MYIHESEVLCHSPPVTGSRDDHVLADFRQPVVHVTLLRVGAVKRCNRSLQPGIFSESTATLGPKHTPVPTYQSSTPSPTVHRCSYKHHDVLGSFRSHVSRTNEGSGLVNMNPSLNSASRLVNMNSACTPFEHSCVYV